jgi:hypothetical protein
MYCRLSGSRLLITAAIDQHPIPTRREGNKWADLCLRVQLQFGSLRQLPRTAFEVIGTKSVDLKLRRGEGRSVQNSEQFGLAERG